MNRIAHFIVHSKAAAYIAALLYIAVWVLRSIGFCKEGNLSDWPYLLLCLIAGYLLVKVGRELLLNDAKTTLPATLFFMGCAISPQTTPEGVDGMHFALFPIACYALLRTYRNRAAMGRYFLSFVLIGVECMLTPSFLITLPCLVLCGSFMESLHVRTFFAAMWGLLLPYWLVGGVLFLSERTELAVSYFSQISSLASVDQPLVSNSECWGQLLWVLLLVLPAIAMNLFDHRMKVQASAGFRLLIGSLLILFVTVVLSPAFYLVLSPCILLFVALIGATFFVWNGSRAKNIYVVVLLLFWLIIFTLRVWNNFMIR